MLYSNLSACAAYSLLRTRNVSQATYISTENMVPNRGGVTPCKTIPDVKSASKYEAGDILLSNIRPYFRKIWLANREGSCSNDVLVLRALAGCDPRFLYYVLCDNNFFNYATVTAKGTKMPRGSKDAIMKYLVPDVDICLQQHIASILSKYDDLIENNNKRIKILEQMAENLYKEWFVRFRFPGHEQSELENGIPAEWEKIRLGQRMSFIRGTSYSSADIQEGENVLLSMNNIKAYGGFIRDFSRLYGGKIKSKHVLRYGDLVMCITDMTQDRRIIGYVGLFDSNRTDCVISTHLMKIETKISHLFLLEFFNASGVSKLIAEFANGTNVLGLTESILCKIKTKLPPSRLIEAYGEKVHPIFDLIAFLKNQNDNLTKQRDMLLPRLMSGKLKVKV